MLFTLGRRQSPTTLTERLLDCHERIRTFLALAGRLAVEPATDEQRAATAGRLYRYFTEALPLHAADEDQSLAPRLRGRSEEVDRALDRISSEHRVHEPLVDRFSSLCGELSQRPGRFAELAEDFRQATEALEQAMRTHLELEERVIFPALDALPPEAHEEAIAEAQTRRRMPAAGPSAGLPRRHQPTRDGPDNEAEASASKDQAAPRTRPGRRRIPLEPIRTSPPVADVLTEHLRDINTQLRTITGLARRLSAARGAPEIEVVDAARRLRRFFADHWPLYEADKETLATRLAGRDGAIDALLTQLRDGLHEQQVLVDRLKTLSATLEAAPKRLNHHIDELSAVTATLERSLDEHLGEEERMLHPLLPSHLGSDEARSLYDEIVARRGPPSLPFESIRL